MATTTTNFGWDIPQSTDLVKDGATAIAALGQDIDTAFVDLKGGTTGQVLAKASGTDLDFSWVAQDDSNAIQNAIVDAKGDLIAASAADTPARLAVGTNGQVLTADSTASTGLAWTTLAAASGPTFKAYISSGTASISTNTYVKIPANTESWDSDNCYDTSTYRFTPTKAGYYLIVMVVSTNGTHYGVPYKNGSKISYGSYQGSSGGYSMTTSQMVYCNGSTDYLEFYTYSSGGTIYGEVDVTSVNATWIRS
jgi:hypothetical protein